MDIKSGFRSGGESIPWKNIKLLKVYEDIVSKSNSKIDGSIGLWFSDNGKGPRSNFESVELTYEV